MDTDLSSVIGQEIVGFRLTAMLGEGGMAAVFRGENLLDPTIVRAIKIVRRELSSRPEFVRRFAEEARILERLNHDNVVRFFGVRRERDWLVMELELLEGRTFAAMLKEWVGQRTPLGTVVDVVQRASEGVAAAHALGVIHRDLKPENLFVSQDGTTKVLDFGIARALDDADRGNRMTVQGTVPGSPAYMAPEVCAGAVPTTAADVYALGLTLYEGLLGHHPFDPPGSARRSSMQLMHAQVNEPLPALRRARPDTPELLEQIAARATAKKPEERYASARELADALRSVSALLPAEAKTRPVAAKSLTEFALPEIASKGGTTAPSTLVAAGGAPTRRAPLVIVAGALSAALLGGIIYLAAKPSDAKPGHDPASPSVGVVHATTAPSASASAAAVPEPPPKNRWVRVEAPTRGRQGETVLLGLVSEAGSPNAKGFRPQRRIAAPTDAFEIQQHEVTWDELDPWLPGNAAAAFERPASVPDDAQKRAHLPVTGVPWETARAYCKSIGGTLPSEEQWEYAARGETRRPFAWGAQPIDVARTHAYAGSAATVVEVMSSEQDVTPGDEAHAIYDLMGNAREWTADLYRGDSPGDDSWVQEGGMTYRALRGLPLASPVKDLQAEGAAYRDALCATGPCPSDTKSVLQWVGFRCARAARAREGR